MAGLAKLHRGIVTDRGGPLRAECVDPSGMILLASICTSGDQALSYSGDWLFRKGGTNLFERSRGPSLRLNLLRRSEHVES